MEVEVKVKFNYKHAVILILSECEGTERFTIGNFTIPIVKRSFLKRIFLNKKKVHFTIGIVKNL